MNEIFANIKISPDQLFIGLTGGIGSGKSTIAAFIREAGHPVLSADEIGRDLTNTHPHVKAAINEAFGEMYLPDASLDRVKMASLVFGDSPEHAQNLARINSIVHPFVWQDVARQAREHFQAGKRLVFNESALLFETGADRFYDAVLVVDADEDVRVRRLAEGRSIAEDEARRRIHAQMPAEEKKRRADYVLTNNGSQADAKAGTLLLLKQIEQTEGVPIRKTR
jgi:dephospho-CoA kinase